MESKNSMLKNELTGEVITTEELGSISSLVKRQVDLESDIAKLDGKLGEWREQLKLLSESTIPDAMMAIGLSELKLSTGESVSIKKYYSASIPGESLTEALDWLRNSGNGDIIKNSVAVSFGKGEDDTATILADKIRQMGLVPEQKTFVHPMTLKSFVKERIENAQELPQQLFGVYVGNKTVIKQPK